MAKIVSKLDLNKTPQLVDNNSLIFAKNIRLLKDGIIGPDFPINEIGGIPGVIVGYIVGLSSTIYLFTVENSVNNSQLLLTSLFPIGVQPSNIKSYTINISNAYVTAKYVHDSSIQTLSSFVNKTVLQHFGGSLTQQGSPVGYKLLSKYPFNSTIEISWSYMLDDEEIFDSKTITYNVTGNNINYDIYEYNEISGNIRKLTTAWSWSGGIIHGVCTANNTGDIILTVCEYFDNVEDKLVPIKHINLSHCSEDDDESIYTQTPNIPYTNLELINSYTNTIPNGVYQFFIRYKIYKDFYTDWFPCSKECFTGNKNITNTIQGSIQYIDTTLNSNESFVFSVKHVLDGQDDKPNYVGNFKEYQIGFIVSHDDSVNARSWKHFPMLTDVIYFDYDKEFIEEINIDDLLKAVYEISNVKNITYFRNKLYIANYIESNFNEDLSTIANLIKCELVQKDLDLCNENITQSINIDGKEFPIIPGTSLYNLGNNANVAITRIKKDTVVVPTNNVGTIYKAYYRCYPTLDPDFFYMKSGCDFSIIDGNATGIYSIPYILPTFCLIEDILGNDLEHLIVYNNQIPNNENNTGILLFWEGNHYYRRPARTERVNGIISNTISYDYNVCIHPLNNVIDWICAVASNSENENGQMYDVQGGPYHSDWYLVKLQPTDSAKSRRYRYDLKNANFNDLEEHNEIQAWLDAEKCLSGRDNNVVNLLSFIRNIYPKYVLKEITIYSNNEELNIITAPDTTTGRTITNIEDEGGNINVEVKPYNDFRGINDKILINLNEINNSDDFEAWCLNFISPNIIDVYGNSYYKDNNNVYHKIDRIEIVYNKFTYSCGENTELAEGTKVGTETTRNYFYTSNEIKSTTEEHRIKLYYDVKKVETNETQKLNLSDRTLVPFTDYKFYVHYIKRNGVVTNGYPLSNGALYNYPGDNQTFDDSVPYSVIYPRFTNITIPDGYDGCFFSIEKVGNNIATCFNYREEGDERIVDCLEVDSMLYPLTDNITLINKDGNVITKKAKYYPSSTTNPAILLGNAGCIRWNVNDEEDNSNEDDSSSNESNDNENENTSLLCWIQILNSSESSNNNRLIKLTPYITEESFDNYFDLNIPGYCCFVCKPIDVLINSANNTYLYVNGSDLYEKSQVVDSGQVAVEIEDYKKLLTHIDTYNLNPYYVYSNFNLSYLTLFDMSYKKLQYKRYAETDSQTGVTVESYKQMLFMLDSSTLSYIYTLPSMYKDYTRKLYSIKQDDKLYIFDNVIRSSDTNTDEYYKYIYKFDAVDYYTVPANKGKIVNLFSITQNIFIHCEHSLFKFSGVNTLTAKDTDVQLTENDVFETGITELFDSKYGYAGLQNKKHSIITFNVYVFYDKLANLIYGYFGDNNLVVLSQPIEKLIANKDVKDIIFANNELENRFFANIIYNNNSNICLSFNFNTKSFASIHDFTFNESFSSRSNCYFLNDAKRNLYSVAKLENTTNYSNLYKRSKLFNKDMTFDGTVVENCLDIVCNIEYEKIKVLNYINWICNQINKYADDIDGVNLFVAEENISKYAGSKLRIYTDQCSTELINLENSNGEIYEQNTQPISSPNSYIYPRYNCGVWSLNYFRDVRNIEDIFKYKDAIPPTQQEEAYNRGLVNSDRSLIYGKYFVLRLIFRNKNFKLENINFNIQDYEKV